MAAGKRLKFQGSSLQVSTGVGSTKTITDVDQTDPALVASTAHGLALGTVGRIAAVVGMTELNDNLYVVENPDTDDFELAGVDATGYTPYVSGGTFAPLTYTTFCELTGVDQQDGTTDEIEVTTICSTAKEFETGLSDSGTLTLNYNFAPNTPVQAAFAAAKKAGTEVAVRITFPNGGGTIVMIGSVQQSSFSGAVSGVWTGSTQLKLTGEVFVLAA
ncbi:phage tail tube protein [Variovorax sp. PAMC 28711]|uniref:phage tail tube protein n=1 Tax=Variovorax sp. PAMC 28711 TaxID=1795631 RepID=UPI00078CCCCE|nr:phage tail tube protein [Variovorax sp. PAMC 28711]AMM23165.1 phage tail protein [Variovorax sp. PAMC 28711]